MIMVENGYVPGSVAEEAPMHLASDYIRPTPRSGQCRIRIYLPEAEQDASVVVCSELPNSGSTSVTYAAEQLAAEVIRSHKLPTPLVWTEHWPSSWSSSLVTRWRSVLPTSERGGHG